MCAYVLIEGCYGVLIGGGTGCCYNLQGHGVEGQ